MKPGSATLPFFGIQPSIVDNQSTVWKVWQRNLVITDSWPGQMRTVYGDHQGLLIHIFQHLITFISPRWC